MSRIIDRRAFIGASAALITASLLPRQIRAAATAHDASSGLYRRAIVIDGNLVPPIDPDGPLDADTVKAVRSSGLTAIKATLGGSDLDFASASERVHLYDRAIANNPGLFMQIRNVSDLATAKRTGRLGIIYSFESVGMLEGKIERIDHFRKLGVRVMQLSYNTTSPFAAGVMSPQPSAGLTALGREAVARMNTIGVSLDLSHSDQKSTLDAIAVSRKPVLITHAGCASIHDHPRNKTDEVLRAVAAKGGVVGIYELSFLTPGPAQQSLDDYLAHLIHALSICGEEHVGIGSDALLMPFDTSPESMGVWDKDIAARKASGVAAPGEGRPPFVTGLNRPDRSEIIADALSKRGYSSRAVEKVLGLNFQRVFKQTWGS
jgi:membrane dipeptidase